MSDRNTPFWERDDAPGKLAGELPAELTPREGHESAIDPDTGTWRPVKQGEPFTVGEHEFRWSEGPMLTGTVRDENGNELGTVHLPFDPDTQRPDDDMAEDARRYFLDFEHMRSIVRRETIDALAAEMHKASAGDGGEPLAETMTSIVADVLAGGLKITMTDDDGSEGLTPEQLAALGAEGERLFNEQLPRLVRDLANAPTVDGLTFWQQFARDVIATATLHARDDITETMGGRDNVAALDDAGLDEFEEQVLEAYRTGPYLAGAMLSLTRVWTHTLGELVSATMSHMAESEDGKGFSEKLLQAARKSLGFPEATPAPDGTSTFTPAFTADGRGHVPTDLVSIGARRSLLSPTGWETGADGRPVFTFTNRGGKALYAPMRSIFPTPGDALNAVAGYGDGHVDLLRYISAKYMANKADGTTGPYGGFYVSVEEFLDARGLRKHMHGGHRTEYAKETVAMVDDLAGIEVRGHVARYRKGRRGKAQELAIDAPLIVISQTVRKRSLAGEETPIAWYVRPGDWIADLDQLAPPYAVMYRAILQLNGQNEMNAKRIGHFLIEAYRIRAHEKSWRQPYRIANLLDGACIEADRKHAGRFRQRIEDSLDVLANANALETPIIASWSYPDPVAASGRGWFDRWLESGVIIIPPADLMEERYGKLAARPPRPRKLASKHA